ncbi:MAG: primosomal protein N' [Nocardioides sp.]|uniref:primosomal protein N' n=1 Tax=Nocardioides sp. TaxID=35761 RepID=UPI0039E65C9A
MTGSSQASAQQEALPGLRATVRRSRATAPKAGTQSKPVAETDPVARVLVDVPLAHLDRPFDYAVPATMGEDAVPGARVRVRFAGQDVDGFVLERAGASDHAGRLTPLRRVVSPEPVLLPEIAGLTGRLAERYAGSRADVLRLAVPPRHATAEKAAREPAPEPTLDLEAGERAWADYRHGDAFLTHLSSGGSPRAVWTAAPAADWPTLVAHAAAATRASGRGVVICAPDLRDVDRVSVALAAVLGPDQHVKLVADVGPQARYRDFLALSRGAVRIAVGTRAAAFAPVHDLGLLAIWDDGDDLFAEPRAPYPHTRETLLLRAEQQGAAALLGGFARSVETAYLLRTNWAHEITAPRAVVRERVTVQIAGAAEEELARDPYARGARLPSTAFQTIRRALTDGPVLVQTPRSGYAPSLACERCRGPARCRHCSGPLVLTGVMTPPVCRWCGVAEDSWACPICGHRGLRAPVLGDSRTAEELGRSFPQVPVRRSSGDHVLAEVSRQREIVVATPGAEPIAREGYAAVVLLDTWLMLARADLRTEEESLRRWLNAAALVRPGGSVVAVGDASQAALQALVRWDPAGFAEREIAQRREARLPPAARLATLTGEPGAVDDLLTILELPSAADVLGPVAFGDRGEWRAVLRAPRSQGIALSRALGEAARVRSARKLDPVRVQVDPVVL